MACNPDMEAAACQADCMEAAEAMTQYMDPSMTEYMATCASEVSCEDVGFDEGGIQDVGAHCSMTAPCAEPGAANYDAMDGALNDWLGGCYGDEVLEMMGDESFMTEAGIIACANQQIVDDFVSCLADEACPSMDDDAGEQMGESIFSCLGDFGSMMMSADEEADRI